MMKYYITLITALVFLSSCEEFENSAEKSVPTFLPYIVMNGEEYVEVDCDNVGYSDEGAVATEGGEEIDLTTEIVGAYFGADDVDGPDYYYVNYSAVNVDGIPGVTSREIFWPACNGDLVNSIAGTYKMSVTRNNATGGLPVDDNGPFFIRDLGNDVYAFSDGMGGWYEHGRGFGRVDGPALGMTVTANDIPANDFTYGPEFTIEVFGGPVVVTALTVDADAGTINFTTEWDSDSNGAVNFTFRVTLTQCPDGVSCWE